MARSSSGRTPASHAGKMSSILIRVTEKTKKGGRALVSIAATNPSDRCPTQWSSDCGGSTPSRPTHREVVRRLERRAIMA